MLLLVRHQFIFERRVFLWNPWLAEFATPTGHQVPETYLCLFLRSWIISMCHHALHLYVGLGLHSGPHDSNGELSIN